MILETLGSEGGSQVPAGIESLDIGDDVFCRFRGALWDPFSVLFGYHGTKWLSFIQILRGATKAFGQGLVLHLIESTTNKGKGVYITTVKDTALNSYSKQWHGIDVALNFVYAFSDIVDDRSKTEKNQQHIA